MINDVLLIKTSLFLEFHQVHQNEQNGQNGDYVRLGFMILPRIGQMF